MSRSYKEPYMHIVCGTERSNHKEKHQGSRRLRRKIKIILRSKNLDYNEFPILKEVDNLWSRRSDGKPMHCSDESGYYKRNNLLHQIRGK